MKSFSFGKKFVVVVSVLILGCIGTACYGIWLIWHPPNVVSAPMFSSSQNRIRSQSLDQTEKKAPKKHQSTHNTTQPTPQQSIPPQNPQPGIQVNSAPNGIAIGGGVVSNPTVNNYAPPQRHLSIEFISDVSQCLSQRKGIASISAVMDSTEPWTYAEDWYKLFSDAGWKIDEAKIKTFMMVGMMVGTRVAFHGDWDQATQQAIYDHNSPGGQFITCTLGKHVDGDTVAITPYHETDENTVSVSIGPQPQH